MRPPPLEPLSRLFTGHVGAFAVVTWMWDLQLKLARTRRAPRPIAVLFERGKPLSSSGGDGAI